MRGVADDWSDVDLHLAVAEPVGFDAITWVEAMSPLVLADRIPVLPGAFVFLTPDCVQLDVVVHGARRLNVYLTEDQLRALTALPPLGLELEHLLDAQRALAGEYLVRARALAARCRCPWPAELEGAVRALWARELGRHL
ncbi:hypothetical protein BJH93_05125 [Kocuria polaris]|nr:hypothetical protein [Kocuria polaris]